MKTYFTADLHLGHKNIIKYSNRPFNSLDEMHSRIFANWNTTVTSKDEVYILGDFGFGKEEQMLNWISQLNGKLYFVPGNHDEKVLNKIKDKINLLPPLVDLHRYGRSLVLCHYPLETWNKKHYNSIHLHGHSHGFSPRINNRLDVGPDNWLAPRTEWFKLLEMTDVLRLTYEEDNSKDHRRRD